MKTERKPLGYVRVAIVAIGMLFPLLLLLPFGSLWLWQQGYIVYWAAAACGSTLVAFLLQLWLFPPATEKALERQPASESSAAEEDPTWTPREREAWAAVEKLAGEADPEQLTTRDGAIQLALATVETVAKRLKPEIKAPLWQFTVPEVLALSERVSGELRTFIERNVPLGDKLTVAQLLRVYRWRGAIELYEKGHDIWRLIRLMNPVTAATHEVREQMTKRLYAWGREHVAKRLSETYVKEIGRAAIDLYGGRLAVSQEDLEAHVSDATIADRAALASRVAEPLRILIAGQVSAGKSSLVNALAEAVKAAVDPLPTTTRFTAYELKRDKFPTALLIDSRGLTSEEGAIDVLLPEAERCDLLLWVCPANRADRAVDKQALTGFRAHFAARLNRRRPPVLLIMTHIDLLRPFHEWKPPYDVEAGADEKAVSIREAIAAARADLEFEADDVVPVSLLPGRSYNVDAIWAKIMETLPEAQASQLVRGLRDVEKFKWTKLLRQAAGAGRTIARAVVKAH